MSTLLRFSEAAALAIHGMVFLAAKKEVISAGTLARACRASESHMVKVCQTLVKRGLLEARRGPAGGFVLVREAETIRLLDVYTAIEGALALNHCLFRTSVCQEQPHQACVFGHKIKEVEADFLLYMESTTLAAIAVNCKMGKVP